jgi:MATE family multidrug resistance protein
VLAVSSIYRQLILFFTISTWSLGSTANTLIGNLVGQQNFTEIKTAVKRISIVSFGFAIFSCVLISIFPDFFIGVFLNRYDNAALLPLAKHSLPVIFMVFILMSFSNIVFNGVISVGDIFTALGIQVGVVIIYLCYFFLIINSSWVNIWWVWTAEWLYWILMFLGSLFFFRYKHLKLV